MSDHWIVDIEFSQRFGIELLDEKGQGCRRYSTSQRGKPRPYKRKSPDWVGVHYSTKGILQTSHGFVKAKISIGLWKTLLYEGESGRQGMRCPICSKQ